MIGLSFDLTTIVICTVLVVVVQRLQISVGDSMRSKIGFTVIIHKKIHRIYIYIISKIVINTMVGSNKYNGFKMSFWRQILKTCCVTPTAYQRFSPRFFVISMVKTKFSVTLSATKVEFHQQCHIHSVRAFDSFDDVDKT